MDLVEQLKSHFDAAVFEYEKFNKGNNAAGTRARKALGELAKVCKNIRNDVTAKKNIRKETKD